MGAPQKHDRQYSQYARLPGFWMVENGCHFIPRTFSRFLLTARPGGASGMPSRGPTCYNARREIWLTSDGKSGNPKRTKVRASTKVLPKVQASEFWHGSWI